MIEKVLNWQVWSGSRGELGRSGVEAAADLGSLHARRKVTAGAHFCVLPGAYSNAFEISQIIRHDDIFGAYGDRPIADCRQQPVNWPAVRDVRCNVVQTCVKDQENSSGCCEESAAHRDYDQPKSGRPIRHVHHSQRDSNSSRPLRAVLLSCASSCEVISPALILDSIMMAR